MKLSKSDVDFFEANGFLLLKNYFSSQEIERIEQETQHLLKEDTPRRIMEKTGAVRSIFAPERSSVVFQKLIRLRKLVEPMEQLLEDKVYIHQSKLNIKAALLGEWWQWHQDYLYWKKEDGMPTSNAITIAIYIDDVTEFNGPMFVISDTHREIIEAEINHSTNINNVEKATLSANLKYLIKKEKLKKLVEDKGGIFSTAAPKGSILMFHGNTLHASNSNLSPYDRKIMFLSYNGVSNALRDMANPRPTYIANRDFTPIVAISDESLLREQSFFNPA